MAGAAKMTKLKMPVEPMTGMPHYEPPTELRINAKKFPGFEKHKVGDKVSFSGNAHVHAIHANPDSHEVILHLKRLNKNG